MKCRVPAYFGSWVIAGVLAMGLAARGQAETCAFELCIERSPVQAGNVTPGSGTHRFATETVVTLSAEPQQGYEFACWLGDVADPAAQSTTVRIDAPKLVVAVFKPAEKHPLEDKLRSTGGGGGPLTPTMIDLTTPGFSPTGGAKAKPTVKPVPTIPTPEPATALLLALGTLALRRRATA